jgi:DNA mismatch endonuclease (patch repair protein)
MPVPSYAGLRPASKRASAAARASSTKSGTGPERLLRKALRELGIRHSQRSSQLPGRPDLVFRKARVVVFCDGDFWHGRKLEARLERLSRGHNADYWVAKIGANVVRDRANNRALRRLGWKVLRFWESEIRRSPERVAAKVAKAIAAEA